MKLILLLFAVQFIAVTGTSNGILNKFNRERKEQIIAENQQHEPSNVVPADPFGQTLIAYVIGTFQSRSATTSNFTAEFQLRLNADPRTQRITVNVDQWNEEFASSVDFELDFYYSDSHQWCNIKKSDCSASFSKNVTSFKLDINRNDGTFFHLLYFDYFNNSFALSRPKDKCTKHQLDGLNDEWTPDPDELSICVCFDEYKPNKLLFCPQDPWNSCAASTPAPTVKPTPPPSGNITCKSIVAYYNGIFSNNDNGDTIPVEFQTRMWAGDQKYYAEIDHWNNDKIKTSDIYFWLANRGYDGYRCDPPTNNNCSAPYSSQGGIWLHIQHWVNRNLNGYYFSYFPASNKQLTLYNAVNGCTKFQPKNDYKPEVASDPNYFDFCMCCGDTYNPPSSLNCPINPWA